MKISQKSCDHSNPDFYVVLALSFSSIEDHTKLAEPMFQKYGRRFL